MNYPVIINYSPTKYRLPFAKSKFGKWSLESNLVNAQMAVDEFYGVSL